MEKPFIEIDAKEFILHPFEIQKPEGYEFAENYPNCCGPHKHNYKLLTDYLERFPFCCDNHADFYKRFKFDKEKVYGQIPIWVLKAVDYTWHTIEQNIDKEDWFDAITEYFELCFWSMGTPAVGSHIYLELVELNLQRKDGKFSKNKCKALLKYLAEVNKYKPAKEKTDLNLLYSTYQKWLKAFPFDLPFFSPLKPRLTKSLPFVKEVTRKNRYLGMVTAKLVTPTELVASLYRRTQHILSLIDTTELQKQGLISQAEKLSIDVLNENHRFRQRTLTEVYNKGEKQYIKTIKKWLENEKDYFKEIVPKLKQTPAPKPKKEKTPKNYFGFKGDTNALLIVLKSLQLRVDMLKENFTTVNNFHKLLTAKDFTNLDVKIHLNCDNRQFYYIVTKLQPYFTNLKWVTIANSMLFLSEGNSLLGQSDLSSAKNNNPKLKTVIDNIFRDMK